MCAAVIARLWLRFALCAPIPKSACPTGVWNRRYTVPAYLSCCLGNTLHSSVICSLIALSSVVCGQPPVQIEGRADQCEMGEHLREIA